MGTDGSMIPARQGTKMWLNEPRNFYWIIVCAGELNRHDLSIRGRLPFPAIRMAISSFSRLGIFIGMGIWRFHHSGLCIWHANHSDCCCYQLRARTQTLTHCSITKQPLLRGCFLADYLTSGVKVYFVWIEWLPKDSSIRALNSSSLIELIIASTSFNASIP